MIIPRLMSLSNKAEDHSTHLYHRVYHSHLKKISEFVVVRISNSFMYDVSGRKYKRTYVYETFEEAEMKQYKMNANFLSRNGLSLKGYNDILTRLQKYEDEDED